MIRLGIIIVILVFVAVIANIINKKYIRPEQNRRRTRRLEIENRELDEQLSRITDKHEQMDKENT